jgi:hypothetical protein
MIVEEDVLQAFEDKDLIASKRLLTDWRQKRYLPTLSVRGRGRGQGKLYFWTDPKVIRQALLVDEIINAGLQGRRINKVLWFLGYEVPQSLVRQALLEGIEKFEQYMTGGNQSGEKIDDHVFDFVSRYYALVRRFPETGLSDDRPPEEMQTFINVLVNPEFDLNEIPYLLSTGAFLRKRDGSDDASAEERAGQWPSTDEDEVRPEWKFVRNIFFIGRLKEALVEASDERIGKVQRDVSLIFTEIAKLVDGILEIEVFRERRFHGAHDFGVILTFIDLALRNAGWDEILDKYVPKIPEYLTQVKNQLGQVSD